MANRHKVQSFARNGKPAHSSGIKRADMSYGNKEVIDEARSTTDGPGVRALFKKDGGKVEGKTSGGRLDKRARGGKIGKSARGGSPFSSASKVKG